MGGFKNKLLITTLLLLILIVAVVFRFWLLDSAPPGLYPDEAVNAVDAARAQESGDYSVFYPNNNGREGLYINIVFHKKFEIKIPIENIKTAV